MTERLSNILANTEKAAAAFESTLAARGHAVTVIAGAHALMVYCGTRYLGRATYEALAVSGFPAEADRLIEAWTKEITAPQ